MAALSIGTPLFGKRKRSGLRPPSFQPTTYLESKIGGTAIIPLPFEESFKSINLKCPTCLKGLFLLFQACTPFDKEGIDRILFVFGCNRFECTRSSKSILSVVGYLRTPTTSTPHVTTIHSSQDSIKKTMVMPTKEKAKFFNPFTTEHVEKDPFSNTKPVAGGEGELVFISKSLSLPDVFIAYPIEFEDQGEIFKEEGEERDISSDSESDSDVENLERLAKNLSLAKELLGTDMQMETENFDLENFEKILPPNIDPIFYNFEKTASKKPWQVVRYSWNGSPLLAQALMDDHELRCSSCNGLLAFECQLMPAMLHLLQTEKKATPHHLREIDSTLNATSKGMEWATILIYSCSLDCGASSLRSDNADEQHPQKDHCIVFSSAIIQHEP